MRTGDYVYVKSLSTEGLVAFYSSCGNVVVQIGDEEYFLPESDCTKLPNLKIPPPLVDGLGLLARSLHARILRAYAVDSGNYDPEYHWIIRSDGRVSFRIGSGEYR